MREQRITDLVERYLFFIGLKLVLEINQSLDTVPYCSILLLQRATSGECQEKRPTKRKGQAMTHTNEGALADFVHRFIPAQAQTEETGHQPRPTLLLLHATGGTENDLLDLGRILLPGAAQLSPRGKILENGRARFFKRLAEGVFDIPDLKFRTHELADFIAVAADAYHLNPSRIIAIGFSNGANMAASLLLLRPGVLAGAILLHPMLPLVPDFPPELEHTTVFIGASRNDPLVSVHETEHLTSLLKQCGANVTLSWHNSGHTINHAEIREAKAWLAR
jgi:phospholipase/carboxylesterase